MIVDIGAIHEADAAPVESAVPPIPHSAQSAANVASTPCFGPETLVRVAMACTPGDWTWKKIKYITPDDHVLGWFQENATTVVREKVRVLCVMAFEQPVTNGVPPALTLVEGAAITPMHHVYVDGSLPER